ncbi:MAG: thiamine pyrophosphate-binding protein [Gaiella sp.]
MLGLRAADRIGGDVVAESLVALGADTVFGLPGVHALPIWEGMRSTPLRVLGFRQELNAAFAADGFARVTGRPTPLVVSTGPGALMTLGALMESATAFVPVVVLSSQIDSAAIGKGRGELHETPDQPSSFRHLVKWTGRAGSVDEIPEVLAEAWRRAGTAPSGPVYVEIPFDVLQAPAPGALPGLDGSPQRLPLPPGEEIEAVAALLAAAERPLIVAGGGAVRSGAGDLVLELAERLGAPVATTYTGKGAVPERHPLALGSTWDDRPFLDLVEDADLVLVVGSWLGYELTGSGTLKPRGTVVQIDAAPERLGLNLPATSLAGDARAVAAALLEALPAGRPRGGAAQVAAVRERIAGGLATQGRELELGLLETISSTLAPGMPAAWDSTILAYTAGWYLRAEDPAQFLYPAGSSTLGYGFPAALGAAAALGKALTVAGDGGFQYSVSELATARQYDLDVALLLVDDGGYGILREYQDGAGFPHAGVDLRHPDFVALAEAYGVPARRTTRAAVTADLAWALGVEGPAVVVLSEKLVTPAPAS